MSGLTVEHDEIVSVLRNTFPKSTEIERKDTELGLYYVFNNNTKLNSTVIADYDDESCKMRVRFYYDMNEFILPLTNIKDFELMMSLSRHHISDNIFTASETDVIKTKSISKTINTSTNTQKVTKIQLDDDYDDYLDYGYTSNYSPIKSSKSAKPVKDNKGKSLSDKRSNIKGMDSINVVIKNKSKSKIIKSSYDLPFNDTMSKLLPDVVPLNTTSTTNDKPTNQMLFIKNLTDNEIIDLIWKAYNNDKLPLLEKNLFLFLLKISKKSTSYSVELFTNVIPTLVANIKAMA